jgi:plasmid stabilization system protein ParE
MRLEYSEDAKQDLQLFRESLNAFNKSGDSFVDKILVYTRKLTVMPMLGPSLQTKTLAITDYRFLVFPFTKKQIYLIIYRIDDDSKVIYINRVFDGRTNYLNVLFSEQSEV